METAQHTHDTSISTDKSASDSFHKSVSTSSGSPAGFIPQRAAHPTPQGIALPNAISTSPDSGVEFISNSPRSLNTSDENQDKEQPTERTQESKTLFPGDTTATSNIPSSDGYYISGWLKYGNRYQRSSAEINNNGHILKTLTRYTNNNDSEYIDDLKHIRENRGRHISSQDGNRHISLSEAEIPSGDDHSDLDYSTGSPEIDVVTDPEDDQVVNFSNGQDGHSDVNLSNSLNERLILKDNGRNDTEKKTRFGEKTGYQ